MFLIGVVVLYKNDNIYIKYWLHKLAWGITFGTTLVLLIIYHEYYPKTTDFIQYMINAMIKYISSIKNIPWHYFSEFSSTKHDFPEHI